MNCSFCAWADVAMTPAEAIAAPSSASLRSPIRFLLNHVDGPTAALAETLEHPATHRNHFPFRLLPLFHLPRHTGEAGRGRAAVEAAPETKIMIFRLHPSPLRPSPSRPPPYDGGGEERAQCGNGHNLSFSFATDHKRARPCGSTIRKNTIRAPKIMASKCETVAVLMLQPNRAPSGGRA